MKTSEALEKLNKILDFTEKVHLYIIGVRIERLDISACYHSNQCKEACSHVIDCKAYELTPKLKQVRDCLNTRIEEIRKQDNYFPWENEDMCKLYERCLEMARYLEDAIMTANAHDKESGAICNNGAKTTFRDYMSGDDIEERLAEAKRVKGHGRDTLRRIIPILFPEKLKDYPPHTLFIEVFGNVISKSEYHKVLEEFQP